MTNKSFLSFYEKLFNRTGRWYPILILLMMQSVYTPLTVILTAMPAQRNAEFTFTQGINLLIFGWVALLIRDTLLLGLFYKHNKDLFAHLSQSGKYAEAQLDPILKNLAWKQANKASIKYFLFEFLGFIFLVLIPLLLFGFFQLKLELEQLLYLGLSALAACLVNLILGNLIFDQLFMPVMHFLIPRQFEAQLTGSKGTRIWIKMSFAFIMVGLISLLLIVPGAFHQIDIISSDASRSPELVRNSLLVIINASIGAIVVGIFISIRLVTYFTTPFRKMIQLFKEIENGDLSRRIEVSYSDEFGEVNIYLNHMIDRIQTLTSTLEQQVVERTAQLNQANKLLEAELAEHKRMEEQLVFTALHDPLTKLPNRVLFKDRLKQAMERARRHKKFTFAVIFMDLDRFKLVNDSLGHNIGDLLLIESSRRLTECVRTVDTVARLGGDEFVILIEEMEGSSDYVIIANRILKKLVLPSNLGGHKVFISVSMGIVLSDARYTRPEDILRDADIAMYHAKSLGRDRYEIFDPTMLDSVMIRLELEKDLRKGLENQEFIIHYQPIIDVNTRRIVGFEALVRWQHPTRELTPPAEFISTAEEIGLIIPLGYWVLDEACRQMHIWQEQYPADPPLTLNVNISIKQCVEKDFVERIAAILQKNNLDPSSLKLELTESLIVENSKYIKTVLMKLRHLGIQVMIDDFGSGYSLLGYLHTLPIDTLKIDRNFIGRLETNEEGSEVVQSILTLAHGLGMKVIAEGVETNVQLTKLESMDCEYVQGFLFAKPVDSREAGTILGKAFD